MKFKKWILDNGWSEKDIPRINALMEADKWTEVMREWKKIHA